MNMPKRGPTVALIIGGSILLLLCIGLILSFFPKGSTNTLSVHTALTRSAPKALLKPSPTPQALFSDTFADNSNNWDVATGSKDSITISNSALNIVEADRKLLRESVPTDTLYDDFSITTTFTINQGDVNDRVGLVLRASLDKLQGYSVDINSDGSYDIMKAYPDHKDTTKTTYAYLVKPVRTSLLQANGQANTITVIMKGANIVLLIGKTVVQSITDSAYTTGSIYLFANNGTTSDAINVSFDSIAIYPAPDQLPM